MVISDILLMYQKSRISLFLVLVTLFLTLLSCTRENEPEIIEVPSDKEITQTLEDAYNKSDEVPENNIDVSTENGVVTLSGSSSNLLAKQAAAEIASSIHGVLSVVNNVKVTADREDEAIEEDVEKMIATNPITERWDISLSVQNGLVTLKGIVDSWQEKQLVGTLVSSVKGVTGIKNNIVMTDTENVDSEEITADVKRSLMFDTRIGDNLIDISVDEDVVHLSGTVGSLEEKNLAVELSHVAGVDSVVADNLEVHPEYHSSIFINETVKNLEPSLIEEALKTALKYDPQVPADQIDVTIKQNTAILTGTVENLSAKLAAERDARNTAGVNSVTNEISVARKVVVTPEVPTTDEAIKKRIKESISRDPYIDGISFSVEVAKGFVNLKGKVDSEFKKQQLEDVVSNVKGVIAIENEITVTNKEPATSGGL